MKIQKLIRPANGSSQPWFCDLENGSCYLVKFSGAGPGPSALLSEWIANRLGAYWGLPIPATQIVQLHEGLQRAGTDEFWDVLDASVGPNLAIEEITDATNIVPSTDLPAEFCNRLRAFDALIVNWDRTAMSANLLRDGQGKRWWIDHGSARFLHHLHAPLPIAAPSTHALGTEPVDYSLLSPISEEEIAELIEGAPKEWIEASGFIAEELARDLVRYLGQLDVPYA